MRDFGDPPAHAVVDKAGVVDLLLVVNGFYFDHGVRLITTDSIR